MKLFLQKTAKLSSAGGSAPRPPKQPPHCEFLATRLVERAGQYSLFNWIPDPSNFVLLNGFKNNQNMIQMTLKWLFFQKIAQRLLNKPPNPRLPNTLELRQFTQHAAQLRPFSNRNILTFVSSPLSPLCKILVALMVAVARFYLTL